MVVRDACAMQPETTEDYAHRASASLTSVVDGAHACACQEMLHVCVSAPFRADAHAMALSPHHSSLVSAQSLWEVGMSREECMQRGVRA